MSEHTAENDAAPERYDDPWDFTVTWEPDSGSLPAPILRLFRHRSTVQPGQAVHHTDKGHSTHYVKAVQSYVAKWHPHRPDIVATATHVPSPDQDPGPEGSAMNEHTTEKGARCLDCFGSGDEHYDDGFRTRSCRTCKGSGRGIPPGSPASGPEGSAR